MKIIGYIGLCLTTLLLAVAVGSLLAPRFGWQVDAVLSGSMEPKLGVGAVVVAAPLNALSLQQLTPGDIVTFHSPLNGEVISHRVVASVEGGFITKGDANKSDDPFVVPTGNVTGKVVFSVPYLGYGTQFVKSRLGNLLTIFVPGLVIIIAEIRNIWQTVSANRIERKYRIAD